MSGDSPDWLMPTTSAPKREGLAPYWVKREGVASAATRWLWMPSTYCP